MKKISVSLLLFFLVSSALACVDSDNGINYLLQGYCYDTHDNQGTDYCQGDFLIEYFCEEDRCKIRAVSCKECIDGICHDESISSVLKIKAKASQTKGASPLTVEFDSEIIEGEAVEYYWDFGDYVVSTKHKTTHTFKKPGKYDITLTVKDSENNQAQDKIEIVVVDNHAPEAELRPHIVLKSSVVMFETIVSDQDGDEISLNLEFGDGLSSDKLNPIHDYKKPGEYTAVLTVRDIYGAENSVTEKVLIDISLVQEGRTLLAENELCPEGYLTKLLNRKAEYESEIDESEKTYKETEAEMEKSGYSLDKSECKIKERQENLDKNNKGLEEIEKKTSEINKEIEKVNTKIIEKQKEFDLVLDTLSTGDYVETNKKNNPLLGLESGGALSFDGGNTWITGKGGAGIFNLIKNLQKYSKEKKSAKKLGKELTKLRKQKSRLENSKNELENEISDFKEEISKTEDILDDLNKQESGTETKKISLEKKLDELEKKINALKREITEFNEIKAECEMRAENVND
ncbi:PKD domain-containing protein [Candidatus Woesearchaeota archaeon]|nr:PKD domain-containing protein [Candidatus Woesearchaeota archaeon]